MAIAVKNMVLSGELAIDGLLSGYQQWAGSTLTFSIATAQSVWPDYAASNSFPTRPEYAIANQLQSASIRTAVATWASYIATPVNEVADNASSSGEIRVAFSLDPQRPTASVGSYPGAGVGGDVWLNGSPNFVSNYEIGSGYYQALLHEVGHALGLKHPFDAGPPNGNVLDAEHSTKLYTVMAYENVTGKPMYGTTFFPTTPMVYDIQAIQYLYGKNTTTNVGNTTYNFSETGAYDQTIYDAGGVNSIAYSGKKTAIINLNEGQGSYVGQENWILDYEHNGQKIERIPNVWIAYETEIKNAYAGDGNDTLIGNSLNNTLSGGAGIDTAVYSGKFASYAITINNDAAIVSGGSDGVDNLQGVERLHFSDVTVALDIAGNAGQAYRVYQAAFNRSPDSSGLGFWIDQMDHGMNLNKVASFFLSSPEAQALYGSNPNDEQLVKAMYSNVLHRAPDSEGYNFWMGHLASGLSRSDMLAYFSESPENKAALIGVMEHGFAYTPV
jgi:hypothetical protein